MRINGKQALIGVVSPHNEVRSNRVAERAKKFCCNSNQTRPYLARSGDSALVFPKCLRAPHVYTGCPELINAGATVGP